MSKTKDIKIILLITLATILGKILGFVKDLLISYHYGSCDKTDAFFLAMSIPTIILGIFTASTDSAVIPQYDRVKMKSRIEADRLFNTIIFWLSLVCGLVSLTEFLFPVFFIRVFAFEFNGSALEYGTRYLRIFSPIGLLHMLYCFYCTYNIAYRDTRMRTVLAFLTNLIVVIALYFRPDPELITVAYAFLFSSLLCAMLPIVYSVRLGYRPTKLISLSNPEFKQFISIFFPIMGGSLLSDIQQYVDKNLASGMLGGISSLNYGAKLINIFDSIFIVGISTVILPRLSLDRLKGDKDHFVKTSTLSVKYIVAFLMPFFTIMFFWAWEIISFIFERGQFNSSDTAVVSNVLRAYSPLVVLMPAQAIFSKFFHSIEETRIPFYICFFGVIVNVILSIVMSRRMGIVGISAATSISGVVTIITFCCCFVRRMGWSRSVFDLRSFMLLVLFSFIVGIISRIVVSGISCKIIKLILGCIIVFVLFFCAYCFVFNTELKGIRKALKSKRSIIK